jgi:hypothetical protein
VFDILLYSIDFIRILKDLTFHPPQWKKFLRLIINMPRVGSSKDWLTGLDVARISHFQFNLINTGLIDNMTEAILLFQS